MSGETPQRTTVTRRRVIHETLMHIWWIIDMPCHNCLRHLEDILFELSGIDLSALFRGEVTARNY